jgi:hypothetical protein
MAIGRAYDFYLVGNITNKNIAYHFDILKYHSLVLN